MVRGMKFHRTTRTYVISLVALIIVAVLTIFLSLTISFFPIDEPIILSSLLNIEQSLDITINYSTMETNIFKQISIKGISVDDNGGNTIATIESITLDTPWYLLLPRYIFNQKIPIRFENSSISINDWQNNYIDAFKSSNRGLESLPFSVILTMKETTFKYNSNSMQMKGEIPLLEISLEEGIIRNIQALAESISFNSETTEIRSKNFSLHYSIDKKSLITSTLSSTQLFAKDSTIGGEISATSIALTYKGGGLDSHGSLQTNIDGLSVIYNSFSSPIRYNTDHLKTTLAHNKLTIDQVICDSGIYDIHFVPYSVSGNSFKAKYQVEDNLFTLMLPDNVHSYYKDRHLLTLTDGVFDLTLTPQKQIVSFIAQSLIVNDIDLINSIIDLSLTNPIETVNPYIRITRDTNNRTYIYETSASVRASTSYVSPQNISFDFSSDGNFDTSLNFSYLQSNINNLKSSLITPTLDVTLAYNKDITFPLSVQIKGDENLEIELKRNLSTHENEIDFKSLYTSIAPYKFLIDTYIPNISSFVIDETRLTGDISVRIKDDLSNGRMNASVAFQDLLVDEKPVNIASTLLASLKEDEIEVNLATLTTTGVRLSYSGSINRNSRFPRGTLEVSDVKKGDTLVSASFVQSVGQQVGYTLTSQLLPTFQLEGIAQYTPLFSSLETKGTLKWYDQEYQLQSIFKQNERVVQIDLPGLLLNLDLLTSPGHIGIELQANQFTIPLPEKSLFKSNPLLTGNILADYSLSDNLFIVQSDKTELENISLLGIIRGRLSTSLEIDPKQVILNNVIFQDSVGTLKGELAVTHENLLNLFNHDFSHFSLSALLSDNIDQSINVTIVESPLDKNLSIASFSIENIPAKRFLPNFKDYFISMRTAGVTNFTSVTDFEGSIDILKDSQNPLIGNIDFSIEDNGIYFTNGKITSRNYKAQDIELLLPYSGELQAKVNLSHVKEYIWRDATTTMNLSAKLSIDKMDSFFSFINKAPSEIAHWKNLEVNHSNTNFLGMVEMTSGNHLIERENRIIKVLPGVGGSITAAYNLDTHFLDIQANENFLFPMKGSGFIDTKNISIDLSYVAIDLTYLNALFAEPIITFEQALFEGNVLIEGETLNPKYFGTMSSNVISLSLYWTGEQKLSLLNPVITLSENTFTLPYTKAVVSKEEGPDSEGLFTIEALFEKWNINTYQFDAQISKGNLSLYVPIPPKDLIIEADASGSFGLIGTLNEEFLYGDIFAPNAKIGFGIKDLPLWFTPKTRTSVELTVTSGKNVTFVYPNEESPLVSATVADNQKLKLSITAPSMANVLEGNIALRSGEIYYVQENFYITEGSLNFPKGQSGNPESSEPRLSLRARLRKFDTSGNRIDIYLILQNDSLTSINPRFDSFPLRDNNEILQILGQNLLNTSPTDNPDGGVQSIVSAASAATDVFSRLGLIQGGGITFGFSSLIRQSLGLDVFSIRSNLLQNILIEAIPGMSSDVNATPISRYLDNTTIYLGKYMLDELYLQGLLTFRRDLTGNRGSFLSEDLAIETELSIEWLTDLATFSFFTQPEELSIFNLFDTMGFSITKTFEF